MKTIVLSVSQLNRNIRNWLENEMGYVSVEGEISNLSKPSSGHFYFTLKDSGAQVRCVYFRNRFTADAKQTLENGQQIIACGKLSLYEARGDYQLIVDEVKQAGMGDLFKQFEELKKKLAALGLFELQRKKEIPRFAYTIGVITSTGAAALRDILTTLARRFPFARVIVYPSEVQGKNAPLQLIEAIRLANEQRRCEVLVLGRGGGSIEDLWAFNNEQLAYAIAESSIPIVSGVGHETDFTIADFVADFRAATPTAAAEKVTPNLQDLLTLLESFETKLAASILRNIAHKKLLINHKIEKIAAPRRLIQNQWQTLDFLKIRLERALSESLRIKKHQLHLATSCLVLKNPLRLLEESKQQLARYEQKCIQLMDYKIKLVKEQLTRQMATLHAVSPLATLERGYSIVTHNQQIVMQADSLTLNDVIDVKVAKGSLQATILKIHA